MVTCPNEKCANHNLELVETTEKCSLCGSATIKTGAGNSNFVPIAILTAIAGFILFWFGWGFMWFLGGACVAASFVTAFLSKKKIIFIAPILGTVAIALIFVGMAMGWFY